MFVIALLVGSLILHFSRLGRNAYAVGSNEEAAFLSGVPVGRVKIILFSLNGLLVGLAGLLLLSRLGAGDAASGQGLELDAIAAAVIGGASLLGGRGSMFGAFLGVMLLGVIANSLTLLDVSSFYQRLVLGGLLIFAVTTTAIAEKRRGRRSRSPTSSGDSPLVGPTDASRPRKGVELMRVGIDVGRHLHGPLRLRRGKRRDTLVEGPDDARQSGAGSRQSVRAAGDRPAGRQLPGARHDDRHELADRAQGRVCGLLTTRGLPRRARDHADRPRVRLRPVWEKPRPLVPRRLRARCPSACSRTAPSRQPLDEHAARGAIAALLEAGVEAIAIALLHSYANPITSTGCASWSRRPTRPWPSRSRARSTPSTASTSARTRRWSTPTSSRSWSATSSGSSSELAVRRP